MQVFYGLYSEKKVYLLLKFYKRFFVAKHKNFMKIGEAVLGSSVIIKTFIILFISHR